MTKKLKPCPFCNGEAVINNQTFGCFVSCKSCYSESGGSDNEDDAIKQWNTRHEPNREFVVNPAKQP